MSTANIEHSAQYTQHQYCFACGPVATGLGMQYCQGEDGDLIGDFRVGDIHQGYTGLLHGGLASTLLDSVMTYCLLRKQINGLTAELTVKFHQPIHVGDKVQVRGRIEGRKKRIIFLSAELIVNGVATVSGKGKFIESK
ncbi:PaaI family thioesterase [Vibrio sp.]|uniref:Acyl-coenzyme A thioesterase THEM4 n=1 Tax=Vibrio viridaestus TaxID=2487322 RepID=A0A3N9TIY1_9VIBR|nr:PaaI family thioesterase [Vibrio viridaestus]MDC0612478.1 PaaI family thioesterase [Vibrio sp.]RQW63505.1 PaaI family thioesterase [Vibrio viridaestus]